MTTTSIIESTATDVYRTLLVDTPPSTEVFAVDPAKEPAAALVDALAGIDDPPTVRLLIAEEVLKWLRRDFHLASTAADLADAGTLSIWTSEDAVANATLTTEESVLSLVSTDSYTAGLTTNDAEFVQSMREQCSEAWGDATIGDLRTPPRSRVYETLADEIGSDVEADYRAMLDAVGSTRSGGYGSTEDNALDEVQLCILAGAKGEVQLFELSNWGEQVGLASKATFSRVKNRLEDHGLVETEKVPVEIGRPRQRLVLSEQLRGYGASDLPVAVRDELQAAPA
jgi:hypothetical protein